MKALAGDSAASTPLLPATKFAIPASSAAEAALLGKGRYKVWALAAIALLALWSMSAASVSLRWSAGDLAASASGDLDAPFSQDLDSLEMEEREKLVGRMWDMYTRTSDEVRLPRFWQEAFEAAYEELVGDDMQVRDAAISEIARMSAHRLELEQPGNENEFFLFPAAPRTLCSVLFSSISALLLDKPTQQGITGWRNKHHLHNIISQHVLKLPA